MIIGEGNGGIHIGMLYSVNFFGNPLFSSDYNMWHINKRPPPSMIIPVHILKIQYLILNACNKIMSHLCQTGCKEFSM